VPQTQRYCTRLGGAVRNSLKLNEHCDLPDQWYSDYCVVLVSLSAHRGLPGFRHSGCIILYPQPRSASHGYPFFTGRPLLTLQQGIWKTK